MPIEAAHHDPARTSAGSMTMYLVGDTLVSLDYDLKTIKPLLAKSWTISEDGKTYTFKLRATSRSAAARSSPRPTSCISVKRVVDKETKSPFYWRMGKVKDVRATDPYTVEYELEEPFSELLPNLAMFQATILNEDNVKALGRDFGVKGIDGTGPYCWTSWEPRNQTVLTRRPEYKWGPPFYANRGPAKFEKIVFKIVPEEAARLAAMASGQMDLTDRRWPTSTCRRSPRCRRCRSCIRSARRAPSISASRYRARTSRTCGCERRSVWPFSASRSPTRSISATPSRHRPTSIRRRPTSIRTRRPISASTIRRRRRRLLDEAGWKLESDGFRYKDGKKLTLQLYGFAGGRSPKVAEAVQGDWRKIGVDLQIQMWDGTIVFSKLAQQDYDIWSIAYPYASVGDAANLYWHSKNVPTPNRMNWKDKETDEWLDAGSAALTEKERYENFSKVMKKVHENAVWVPIVHEGVVMVANKKLKNLKAHNIYASMLYKALDVGP